MYEHSGSEQNEEEAMTPEQRGEDYLRRQREALALALGQSLEAGQGGIPFPILLSVLQHMTGKGR